MKSKLFFAFLLLSCVFSQQIFAQTTNWLWADNPTGVVGNGLSMGNCICTDTSGNAIAAGPYEYSALTFGSVTLPVYGGNSDVFVVKYDPVGNVMWAKNFGGLGNDVPLGICADKTGNIYVSGYFNSLVLHFSPTDSIVNLSQPGYYDLFLAKYDPNGNLLWRKNASGWKDDNGCEVTTDDAGNVFLTGEFNGNITFGSTTLWNTDGTGSTTDIFLAKYDTNGNVLWAKSAGGSSWDGGRSVSTDHSGNVYIGGIVNSLTLTFGFTTLIGTYGDIFIAKYDANGNFLWAQRANGSNNNSYDGGDVVTDPNGDIYFSGYFTSSTTTFGSITLTNPYPPYSDVFLVKFDPSGNVIWAKSAGGSYIDESYSVSTDPVGNVYVIGTFMNDTITFNSTVLTAPAGSYPIFIVKYDPDGNVVCSTVIPSTGNQMTDGISADAFGNAYVTGTFYGNFYNTANPNTLVIGSDTLIHTGVQQIFVAKYNCCGAQPSFSSDTTIVAGQSVPLVVSGGTTYSWSTGATSSSIVVSPASSTNYCVTVADGGNCVSENCFTVNVNGECSTDIFIANAFSPNGDGANDVVRIRYNHVYCIDAFYIAIYDRWGEKVFESTDPGFQWDGSYHGQIMFSQVLAYYIKTTSVDGKEYLKQGNISLIL